MIPSQYKQRGREGKWILKKAISSYLPHDVIYRPKSGFEHLFADGLMWSCVSGWLIFCPKSVCKGGLFDPLAVQRLIDENAAGRLDASYTLLSLACIEIWCKSFIDRDSIASINL